MIRNTRHDHLEAGVKGRATAAGHRQHYHTAAALYVQLAAAMGISVAQVAPVELTSPLELTSNL